MSVQVQRDLFDGERLSQTLGHRGDLVGPWDRSTDLVATLKRKPRANGTRSKMETTGERIKKLKSLPSDETVFYSNIWSPPETRRDVSAARKSQQLVDISQVAHVLTSLDYKSGYEEPGPTEVFNIWGPLDAQQEVEPIALLSKPQHTIRNASARIPDHSTADSSAAVTFSSTLSLGPLKVELNTLPRVLSSDSFASVKNVPVSAPYQRGPNVVFSNVLTRNGAVDMSWSSQFLLGLHEPVRHALFVIDRFLERSRDWKSPMNWNVREFFSWFKLHFVEFVRNQRDVKTTVLLPLVVIKFGAKRDIFALYEDVFALMDVVVAHEDGLLLSAAASAGSWTACLGLLQDDIRRLNHLLLNVLTREEESFKPAIELAFSERAFQRYVMPRIFRAMRPKRVMVPWIVERSRVWGDNKVAKAYKDELSLTARFLYEHVWHPYFKHNIASAMKHLDNDVEGLAAAKGSDESCFGCIVM